MTDNEIIKALKCCSTEIVCDNCPYGGGCVDQGNLRNDMAKDALALINRQKTEIERLRTLCKPTETSGYKIENGKVVFYTKILNGYRHEYKSLDRVVNDMNIMLQNAYKTDEIAGHYKGKLKTAKSEAIKEFEEKFKRKAGSIVSSCQGYEIYETKQYQISAVDFDNLVKEMGVE